MGQMGVTIAPSTILRRLVRYSTELAECWRHLARPVGRSCRCDETYVKVSGCWMYRTAYERSRTVESHLSRTRDVAAKAFFRKALKRHGQPRTITVDGFEATHSAGAARAMRNEFNVPWENLVRIRCCQYLNNVVEQDHRPIKSRVQPMLGFTKFSSARRVLIGIEFIHIVHKGQFDLMLM
jgi:transposase-like protein